MGRTSLLCRCYFVMCGSAASDTVNYADTWQKLTPLVSRIFYDGGNVPDEVRKEILKLTELAVKDIVYNRSRNMEYQEDEK